VPVWVPYPTMTNTAGDFDRGTAAKRIELLENFLAHVRELDVAMREGSAAKRSEATRIVVSKINRTLEAVRTAVEDAGIATMLVSTPSPMTGGIVQHLDAFTNLFRQAYAGPVLPLAVEMVERAIGVYENLRDETGLVRLTSTEAIDIVSGIERALRPAFTEPPKTERQVQDAIATILRAQGVDFHREKERAALGPTTFIPDYTVGDLDLAVEVKLAKPGHGEAEVQRELAEDIAAYRTRWRHLIAVVYDCGVISDPDLMRRENMKHFGVTVLIVKH
jgi:hypothetical protein